MNIFYFLISNGKKNIFFVLYNLRIYENKKVKQEIHNLFINEF